MSNNDYEETKDITALAAEMDEENGIQAFAETASTALTRSEIDAQLTAAHRFPRSVTKFIKSATQLATFNREIAESCMYALPRGGKPITGPSVRLAEICASCYGNLHLGSRVMDADDTHVVSQGVAWDLEKNNRFTVEVKRRITDKWGKRYNEDMITVTGAAGASIALRNAIFRIIPRTYINQVYDQSRRLAVGDAKSFVARRDEFLTRIMKQGVTQDRVLLRLGRAGIDDIELTDLEILVGLGTAIRDNQISLDEAFPAVVAAPAIAEPVQDGKRMSLGRKPAKADREPGDEG